MRVLPFLILLLFCYCWCQETILVRLPSKNPDPINGKTLLTLDKAIELNNILTLCIRFKLKSELSTITLFSSKDGQLALYLVFLEGKGRFAFNGQSLIFKIPEKHGIQPFHWHHLCLKSNDALHEVVVDGRMWHYGKNVINANEKTILNEIILGSAYQVVYSNAVDFLGEISELNIWSRGVSLKDLMEMTNNCGEPKLDPDLLRWSLIRVPMIFGDQYQTDINLLCMHAEDSRNILKLFPYQRNQDEALFLCQNLNGRLAYPTNKDEYLKWQSKFSSIELCKQLPSLLNYFFVVSTEETECQLDLIAPIKQLSNGSWEDRNTGNLVSMDDLWRPGQPNGGTFQQCTCYHTEDVNYYDEVCNYKSCFVCSWKNEPTFTLRGLCVDTQIDEQYVLLPELSYDGNVYFFGFRHTNILFNKDLGSWIIVEDLTADLFNGERPKKIVGIFELDKFEDFQFPIGKNMWNLTDKCSQIMPLKLAPVSVNCKK